MPSKLSVKTQMKTMICINPLTVYSHQTIQIENWLGKKKARKKKRGNSSSLSLFIIRDSGGVFILQCYVCGQTQPIIGRTAKWVTGAAQTTHKPTQNVKQTQKLTSTQTASFSQM